MSEPAVLSEARNRAVIAQELRRLLPKMEGLGNTEAFPFGLSAIDHLLPHGGLCAGALHEIVPVDGHSSAAALGFAIAILARLPRPHPLFLVMPRYGLRHYGRPFGHGLNGFGLNPDRLVLVETGHRRDSLWALEEALRSGAPAAVAGVIDTLDLKLSQRLHHAAAEAGLPLLLLRPPQTLEASAAATRWRVGTAEAARDRFGLIVRTRWHLALERCRNGRPGEWIVEYDHVAHRFSLAAALADRALSRGAENAPLRTARRS